MKKKTAVLLLAAVLTLTSCGIITVNVGRSETETSDDVSDGLTEYTYIPKEHETVPETDGESAAKSKLDALPAYDFDGVSVFIASASEIGDIFNAESGIYSAAVAKRNQYVSEKYHTSILMITDTAAKIEKAVASSVKSGDYYADLAVIPAERLGTFYSKNYVRNLRTIPGFDIDAECFNGDASAQMSVRGGVYAAVGYANEDITKYGCIYANNDLLSEAGITLDCRSICEGAFTWESFLTVLKALPNEKTALTSASDKNETAYSSFFSLGVNFVDTDTNSLIVPEDELDGAMENIRTAVGRITSSVKTVMTDENGKEKTVTVKNFDIFASGKSAFSFGTLGNIGMLENCGFSFEILPMPKTAEQESYATPVSDTAPVTTVLRIGVNEERIGYILTALNIASEGYVKYSFYSDATNRLITQYTTLDMIDLVAENPMYDFAGMFSVSSKALADATSGCITSYFGGGDTPFSELFAEKRDAAAKYLGNM